LVEGDTIAVVAPSGACAPDKLQAGIERLKGRFDVRHRPDVFERRGYLAGEDRRRLDEIKWALEDSAIKGIVAGRGGYGAMRIVSQLDLDLVRDARKLLVGFSDITALHATWARAGVGSLHAPMVETLSTMEPSLYERWLRRVAGEVPAPVSGLAVIAGGEAHGALTGGNLAVLAALAGTPFAAPVTRRVLFLEDVGERPFRVDRMLTTLRLAGWFDSVAGVVLGSFTDVPEGHDRTTTEEVITEHFSGAPFPVLLGVPSGHHDDNLELPLGTQVAVSSLGSNMTFETVDVS
jgi:muramoyltetrapeptide carboxypeptidase